MFNNSSGAGPYDFAYNTNRNDTFCVNGKRMDAAAFGNFIAGYQGRAYDEYVLSPFPALLTMYAAGLFYHNLPNESTSQNDRLDRSGFPFIHLGAESVPDSPAMQAGVYDSSPIY
jgi:hypothetical protein